MGIENRGFASMNKKRRKELASKGGLSTHKNGTGNYWTSKTAKLASKKGLANRWKHEEKL